MSTSTTAPAGAPAAYKLSPAERRVFIGLMLGMFVASVSQTIVGPAMPRIVAEFNATDHYSWVATAAMLVSAISVPIVGKLADLYGRREFYLGGLVTFMIGSVICGFSQNFWMLVFGRAVQGLGMGTLMPLSQTIIGDIIPARQRGKYQGVMGAVFGLTSVAGPLAGGFLTDHWGWRILFFVSIPIGLAALFAIARFLHLPHESRRAEIDFPGFVTLGLGLTAVLLATSIGGTSYPWGSWQIISLYAVGALLLVAFVLVERRAAEPVLPLRLFRSSIFTFSNIAAFAIAMMMFGAIIYIPVFAQGVIGVNATNSGLILMPLMVGLVVVGILAGFVVTRTGHYKELMIAGLLIMMGGVWLLTKLDATSTQGTLTVAMIVFGVGLGMAMQLYTLVVQNAATRKDLGVATASTQFFRNVGSTVGIAIFGTVMSSGLHDAVQSHLSPQMREAMAAKGGGGMSASSVLDPEQLKKLPAPVATAVREGMADQLHEVFLLGFPILVVALVATLFIKAIPLRDTVHTGEEAGREMLDTMAQTSMSDELVPGLGHEEVGARTRERILGIQLGTLAREASRADRPLLRRAVTDLGDGDLERGIGLLQTTAMMLTSDDPEAAAGAESVAAHVSERARRDGGILSKELRQDLAVVAADASREQVLRAVETPVHEAREAVDVTRLRHAANDLSAAFLVDVEAAQRTRTS